MNSSRDAWSPIVLRYFSSVKPARAPFTKYLRQAESKKVQNMLHRMFGSKKIRILDISSEPRIYESLVAKHHTVVRIDFAECFHSYLKKRNPRQDLLYLPDFAENLDSPLLGSFDAVLAIGPYNYIPDPHRFTVFCCKHLKENGKLITTLKTKKHPDARLSLQNDRTYSVSEVSKLFPTMKEIDGFAKYVPGIHSVFSLILLQAFLPIIKMVDKRKKDKKWYLTRERSWYYVIAAEK